MIKDTMQTHYNNLMTQIGDLHLKQVALEEKLLELRTKAKALIEINPHLIKDEEELKAVHAKELEDARSKCANCTCNAGPTADQSGVERQEG